MAPYWFPVLTLVLGAAIGYVADAMRDSRAAARELAAAGRSRKREADAFQRETLVELQDWLTKLTRATGAIHHGDELRFRESDQWGRSAVRDEWNEAEHEAWTNIDRLRVRVGDDEVRKLVRQFVGGCAVATKGAAYGEDDHAARARSVQAMEDVQEMRLPMHERIGEVLRELA